MAGYASNAVTSFADVSPSVIITCVLFRQNGGDEKEEEKDRGTGGWLVCGRRGGEGGSGWNLG